MENKTDIRSASDTLKEVDFTFSVKLKDGSALNLFDYTKDPNIYLLVNRMMANHKTFGSQTLYTEYKRLIQKHLGELTKEELAQALKESQLPSTYFYLDKANTPSRAEILFLHLFVTLNFYT